MTLCKHIAILLMAWLSLLARDSIAEDRDNGFRQLSTKEGLRLRLVRGIDQDKNGYIWLGAVNTLIKYDGHTFQEFGDPLIGHRSIRQVVSDGFDQKWMLLTDSGHEKEIVVFDEKTQKFDPNTYLENIEQRRGKLKVQRLRLLDSNTGKLTAYPEAWDPGQPVRVEPHYAGFEMEVHLMDFMQNHTYAYKINELQEKWSYQKSPKILIAGLDPGKYNLTVKGQNRYGQWLDQITVPLYIITPTYHTWWFRTSVVLSMLLFGVLLHKFRVNQIKKNDMGIGLSIGRDLNTNSRTNGAAVEINPREQHFLKEVVSQIQSHLSDGSFGVSELSERMYMSRKNLHRKLKALTGQSPVTFIRVFRLKASLELLQSGKYNISEVSFLVGFNSPTYFSKCFQEHYGFSPKNVLVDG